MVFPTPCDPSEFAQLLPDALEGKQVLAPIPPDSRASTLAMLRPAVAVEQDDAALILPTSGSTGSPKGVVLSRQAVIAAALMSQHVTGPLAWTLALPAHYVAGAMVLVRAAVAGKPVTNCRGDLADLAIPKKPSAISIVPTQLHRALSVPTMLTALAAYRVVLLGGAAASPADLAAAEAAGVNVITTYGMSETCGGCVWDGKPLPGVEVSLGDEGRISLSGPMVFSGYRLRPELTEQTLVDAGVLTQDRGRWVGDRLEIIGRFDDVVITGGVNVDLAGVRRRIMELTRHDVEVFGVDDPEWGTRIVLATTDSRDLDHWRDALRSTLEPAALPRQLIRLDRVPHTASGKIDRRRLIEQAQFQA